MMCAVPYGCRLVTCTGLAPPVRIVGVFTLWTVVVAPAVAVVAATPPTAIAAVATTAPNLAARDLETRIVLLRVGPRSGVRPGQHRLQRHRSGTRYSPENEL